MKNLFKILTIIFLFSYNQSFSQESIVGFENFKFDIQERKVLWVKVFEPENQMDLTTLKQYFIENQILEVLSQDSSSFRGSLIPKSIDIQKYGYKRGTTPMFLLDVEQKFNVKAELKDGKYRITLSDMGYIDNGMISDLTSRALVGNTSTTTKGNFVTYDGEFSFTNKNEVRTRNKSGFEILNKFYLDIFTIKKKSASDW
ncbi:MAG: hypothetical protein LPK25_13055 [Cyclobacteriaceae bacterium]|nr:hypothetical protein [Cyclobacteriaceae bacterium]MDX5467444.1 hypothetical protein [Cyclobacteriaceae bacterium]